MNLIQTSTLVATCLICFAPAQEKVSVGISQKSQLTDTKVAAGVARYQVISVNNFTYWVGADGSSGHAPNGFDGGIFPAGTANVIFQDGFVWGGKVFVDAGKTIAPVDQRIRVGGATYSIGTRVGVVSGFGADAIPADTSSQTTRIFRIRRDYYSLTQSELAKEASVLFQISPGTVVQANRDSILAWYDRDWREWPVNLGAPFIERNGTPGFQAPPPFSNSFTIDQLVSGQYDEPGMHGSDPDIIADQVIWTAFNDLDQASAKLFAASKPIGLEMQSTTWAFKKNTTEGNIVYRRLKIVNKGGVDTTSNGGGIKGAFTVDSMFVMYWSDPDIGSAGDDLAGCDTSAQLGYAYNGQANDSYFQSLGLMPPATGILLLQGPVIPSVSDVAIIDFAKVRDKKNLPMSSFSVEGAGDPYSYPASPSKGYDTSSGAWWKYLRGYVYTVGGFSAPDNLYNCPPGYTGNRKFAYPGNPVTGEGWILGQGTGYFFGPGDYRMMLTSGPFSLAPGDTQVLVWALVAGIGSDRLSSITKMKEAVNFAQTTYDFYLRTSVDEGTGENGLSPIVFTLSQNFPNPFNPETQVRFKLPITVRVSLKIFDLLGREVATLVNGVLTQGVHTLDWNGKLDDGANAPSGMYICRLEAGARSQAIKVVLLR